MYIHYIYTRVTQLRAFLAIKMDKCNILKRVPEGCFRNVVLFLIFAIAFFKPIQ